MSSFSRKPDYVLGDDCVSFIVEFFELEQDEILDWWTVNKLPHPGCPESFRMVQHAMWLCHSLHNPIYIERRRVGVKQCLSHIHFLQIVKHRTTVDDEGSFYEISCAQFLFPYKGKTLLVPLTTEKVFWSDFELIQILLGDVPRMVA